MVVSRRVPLLLECSTLGVSNGFLDLLTVALRVVAVSGLFLSALEEFILNCGDLVVTDMECVLLVDVSTMLVPKVDTIIAKCLQ
tara:strand:+ start:322 stop:573 length:252 start_codon:yes stop_codon:yes gene_type:complete